MKTIQAMTASALLIMFCSVFCSAQQPVAATNTRDLNVRNEAFGASVSGTGEKNYVPLWLGPTKLGNSTIFQSSVGVGIGTTSPAAALDVNGAVNAATSFDLGGAAFAFGTPSSLNAFVGFSGNSSMTGRGNTANGVQALLSDTTGGNNTAIGSSALAGDTTGGDNTAVGLEALASNTTGNQNTATGVSALLSNTTGNGNEASGFYALRVSTTGSLNTADGAYALVSNTTGGSNTGIGFQALVHNTTGSLNTATGSDAIFGNTTGNENTAEGFSALVSNTSGSFNGASGYGALGNHSTGGGNTATGWLSLYYNTTGSENTALGYQAGPDANSPNLINATAIGANAVVSQSNSLILGGTGNSAVKVGIGTATPSNVLTIGRGAGQAISDGWSVYSSRRWKTNIETLHGALGKIEQLRGVSYELKANGKHEVGVIAEEVGAVVPEVVTWDQNGKDARSVDYSRLTALLIEATKEQQALIEQQQEQIAQLMRQMKTIKASLKSGGRRDSEVRTVKAGPATVLQ